MLSYQCVNLNCYLLIGHQWLLNNLRVIPRFGWSVDAFGHSSTHAHLLALSGINATVIQRIHYAWKQWLASKRYLDFIWTPNWMLPNTKSSILTHNQPFKLYTTKSCGPNEFICSQFDFRIDHEDYPINVDENTIESLTDQLIGQYARTGSLTEHNVILVPLGCDFCFRESMDWDLVYENYNKIIRYAKKQQWKNVDIQFGTVKTYFDEILHRAAKFPTLKGDFFVYADLYDSGLPGYWSGYFTTRPYFKILDRYLEAKLRSAEILYAMALYHAKVYHFEQMELFKTDFSKIVEARQTLALFQHHDSITGTSKSFVMKDHAMRLLEAIYNVNGVQRRSVRSILFPNDFVVDVVDEYVWNELGSGSKQTIFNVGNGSIKKIIFFNPLAQRRIQCIKVLTNNVNTKVRLHNKKKNIPIQISPVWEYFSQGTKVFISPEKFELSFFVNLSPMSLTTYELYYNSISLDMPRLYSNTNLSRTQFEFELGSLHKQDIQIENSKYTVRFDGNSGLMKSIFNKGNRRTIQCTLDISAYSSAQYLSGAYIFQPESNVNVVEKEVLKEYDPIIHVVIGRIYSQLTVVYGNFLSISIRIYNSSSYLSDAIHLENALDFGGSENLLDTELFMRFVTNIQNSDPPIMYTDSNGFHMQERKYVADAGIPGNYFPITTMAYIEDQQVRLSLLTNHAHGAASIATGRLEIMLDRRIIYDDDRGLAEGVVDNTKITNEFWLLPEYFESVYFNWGNEISRPSMFANHMSNSLNYPINLFSIIEWDPRKIIPVIKLFRECFPCDVHVVNLRVQPRFNFLSMFSRNAFLILHRQGYTCNFKSSYKCTNVEFKDNCAFDAVNVTRIVPMSLTGLKKHGKPFAYFSLINLPPMSLQTFNVTFL